jgi:hypothetical protein
MRAVPLIAKKERPGPPKQLFLVTTRPTPDTPPDSRNWNT